MSLVSANDGYSNIFGPARPLNGPLGALDKVVSSPVFPMLATAIVGAGAGAAFGAGSVTTGAIKMAPTAIGALTGATVASSLTGTKTMADPTTAVTNSNTTQLPGNTAQAGTAQLPGQPIIINAGPAPTQTTPTTDNSVMYLGLAAVLYLLLKRK